MRWGGWAAHCDKRHVCLFVCLSVKVHQDCHLAHSCAVVTKHFILQVHDVDDDDALFVHLMKMMRLCFVQWPMLMIMLMVISCSCCCLRIVPCTLRVFFPSKKVNISRHMKRPTWTSAKRSTGERKCSWTFRFWCAPICARSVYLSERFFEFGKGFVADASIFPKRKTPFLLQLVVCFRQTMKSISCWVSCPVVGLGVWVCSTCTSERKVHVIPLVAITVRNEIT